ncbi:hypothetical protein N8628_00590 [Verrucomicrobia bacterium]|nr:hypothetical protein [Verrucomicrobiota bacterium]
MPEYTCDSVGEDKETIFPCPAQKLEAELPENAAFNYYDNNYPIGFYVRVRDEDDHVTLFDVSNQKAVSKLVASKQEVDEDNPALKNLIYDLISKHGSSRSEKLDFLKQEGHKGFFVTNKEITKVFESAVKESALKTFKKNEKANRLAKERTDSIKKVTALLASRSILELELNDRHKIDNNLLSIAKKYKNHPLEKYEIEFLESYSNAKHLQIGNELLAMTSDNSGIKKAAGKVGVASTIAAVSSAIVHNQMAESISNIEENTEEIADSFDE